MLTAIAVLTVLGLALGTMLGIANKFFAVEEDPVIADVEAILPGSNCGQCGFPGCSGAAVAIANGDAAVTCCPPGGRAVVQQLAQRLGIEVDLSNIASAPQIAQIDETRCTGCCRCYRVCPTDAIMGANKQIHVVFTEACTGCQKCLEACPEDCVSMSSEPETLDNWHWPKPAAA